MNTYITMAENLILALLVASFYLYRIRDTK